MASKKLISERILEMQNRKEQLENQIKQLTQKHKEEERKARTRRLIERGALLESFIDGAESLTNEQIKEILSSALASRDAADTNTMRNHHREERVMESDVDVEDIPPRRRESVETPVEETPPRRREPPRAPEEFRRPRA